MMHSISLGCGDVFKIKAIYESTDSTADPIIPNLIYKLSRRLLLLDDVITGDTSGSRARIVCYNW